MPQLALSCIDWRLEPAHAPASFTAGPQQQTIDTVQKGIDNNLTPTQSKVLLPITTTPLAALPEVHHYAAVRTPIHARKTRKRCPFSDPCRRFCCRYL